MEIDYLAPGHPAVGNTTLSPRLVANSLSIDHPVWGFLSNSLPLTVSCPHIESDAFCV